MLHVWVQQTLVIRLSNISVSERNAVPRRRYDAAHAREESTPRINEVRQIETSDVEAVAILRSLPRLNGLERCYKGVNEQLQSSLWMHGNGAIS